LSQLFRIALRRKIQGTSTQIGGETVTKQGCECKVGPGKFEGEPVESFLLWRAALHGCADRENGAYVAFEAPLFHVDTNEPDLQTEARDYGYCDACIRAAIAGGQSTSAILWESDQGFVSGTYYDDRDEFEQDWAAVEEEESDHEDS
jgi:hypothetical protein